MRRQGIEQAARAGGVARDEQVKFLNQQIAALEVERDRCLDQLRTPGIRPESVYYRAIKDGAVLDGEIAFLHEAVGRMEAES
jgi:hypothetical protein